LFHDRRRIKGDDWARRRHSEEATGSCLSVQQSFQPLPQGRVIGANLIQVSSTLCRRLFQHGKKK